MAVLAPALATGVGLILQPGRALGAISIYLLGVVVAAALGGLWSGLVASVISLLCINYFFTEPLHTFRVTDSEDIVADLESFAERNAEGRVSVDQLRSGAG